ncbi:restriction endonuclease subunit S [Thiolapillus sp.]|uniref:restriction endonuclease subunit S n=2 Tax=Thiolapillus sp. TaxID=2017437 RepID=UPI003AF5B2B4
MAGEASAVVDDKGWLYHPYFPDHWKRCPLYSLAQWVNGLAFRNIQFSDSGLPVIKIAEIKGGISGQTKFTQQTFDDAVRVRYGDLLFSWSGQPETSIDAFWWRDPEGWLNQHIFRVTPTEGIDPVFFYYLLRYLKPNFVGIARNKQTTGLGHITKRDLENLEAAYPRLPEQRAIAHILGSLDDKIELNRQMAQTLESIARAIFKSWFVDFDPVKAKMEGKQPEGMSEEIAALFPDRLVDSELGMIPEGWDIATMQDLGTIKGGATPSTKNPDYWEGGTNHWITPKDMSNLDSMVVLDTSRKITDAGMQRISSRQLPADTVLMSSRAPVGYLAISAIPISINQGFIAIVCNKGVPNSYVLYLLESNMDKIKMSAGGSTFSEISKRNFRPIKIFLSNNDLLVKFNEIIEPLVDKITRLRREVTTLASLRDALLHKLISGELRIKDSERFLGKVA